MLPDLRHECTRLPVTALCSFARLCVAADGPFLSFYDSQDFSHISSERIFEAQAIHGISLVSESTNDVILVAWGGMLVRTLTLRLRENEGSREPALGSLHLSNVVKAPDWVLDLCSSPFQDDTEAHNGSITHICAGITAHNALLELTVVNGWNDAIDERNTHISIVELTSSSRSILYSAHLLWDSATTILVAAGTAFGEIMYWSWNRDSSQSGKSSTHRVFLGHEGSIFGVQISKDLVTTSRKGPRRFLASCSDDRTIRIWDVSCITASQGNDNPSENPDAERTRHTGFSNASFDTEPLGSGCLAIGWGHTSRVWTVRFSDPDRTTTGIFLLSTGEDATLRTWELIPSGDYGPNTVESLPYKLIELDRAAYHSGKNLWSAAMQKYAAPSRQVLMGGADSKIVACPIDALTSRMSSAVSIVSDFAIEDIIDSLQSHPESLGETLGQTSHRSSKRAEFFRSYTFIDNSIFLLTTNLGNVYLKSIYSSSQPGGETSLSRLVGQSQDLAGYSICVGVPSLGIAFVAGARGSIYLCRKEGAGLSKIYSTSGKIGDMFVPKSYESLDTRRLVLLITMVGKSVAYIIQMNLGDAEIPSVTRIASIAISEQLTGLTITSMEFIPTASDGRYLVLGFRRGSIAVYVIPPSGVEEPGAEPVSPCKIVEKVHGKEAVTSMFWVPSNTHASSGNVISTGRDGCIAVHSVDLPANSFTLVHNLTLPVGPNLEGIQFSDGQIAVYGFSSKKFVYYDYTKEEEIMSVETGGAHRSWAFQSTPQTPNSNTLVWTRASSLHICHQISPIHQVIRSGGHGREIKAVAVSCEDLIATGAEDTDIKIFQYKDNDIVCRRTLRKHTTGIQHLKWSNDGEYLFSSGGCEEFYVWRVRILPPAIGGIGVICESVYEPESEHSDLRIMSFDAERLASGFVIAMVFSDSSIKAYSYDPTREVPWCPLAKGVYFTSCLTQCAFLSLDSILTSGTDGHAVIWDLPSSLGSLDSASHHSVVTMAWKQPVRIHQNTSKTLAARLLDNGMSLVVSGGDDGSIAFLVLPSGVQGAGESTEESYINPPTIVTRAHGSAVTACTLLTHDSDVFLLTSGNDQWIRLWEIIPRPITKTSTSAADLGNRSDPLDIRRLRRIKTNVADVSSMAEIEAHSDGYGTRVLVCGVGMEVIRVEWETAVS